MPDLRAVAPVLHRRLGVCLAAMLGALTLTTPARAQTEAPAARPVDFVREVQPILAKRCFACHGPDETEGGLRLNGRDAALAELDSGDHAIVPGNAEQSTLLARVSSTEEGTRMPPEGAPLTEAQIDVLRRWIREGAKWPKPWAFNPPEPRTPPQVRDKAWVRNPIDAFILARLEQNDLHPAAPADKLALLRRATYDLTGLPPSPAEVAAFAADDSADAYERLVDRLLESPHYGERWARHWLDVVRFAETNSFERDGSKPNAWRYRDYVIRSFNDDKPYDQFIREQLAGDELDTVTNETIIATGYYRLGLWDDEPADMLQARFDEFDDIVTTTGQAFLGLTINCARCHDHKIDPIPQTDYYQLVAFFADLRPYATRNDTVSWNQTDISPPGLREKHLSYDQQIRETKKERTQLENAGIKRMPKIFQVQAKSQDRFRVVMEELDNYLDGFEREEYERLQQRVNELETGQRRLPPREQALSVTMCFPQPEPMHVMLRGNPHVPGAEVSPGYPTIYGAAAPMIAPAAKDAKTAGRRRVLADWIASPTNMLTARVMANRIWQHHFGRGIVRSPNNFGQGGEPPTHPELLDWLAEQYVAGGWHMKPLHKLIMMSNAYRMASTTDKATLARDPANDLFSRFNARRLSAEELRDTVLAVSGQFNPKSYGPSVYPTLSKEVHAGQSMPGQGWGKSSPEEQARRSIYIFVKRSLITPMMASFDFPDPDSSCEARFATTQPGQALGMINGDFIHQQAAAFAARLQREAGNDLAAQVALALRLAMDREPKSAEIDAGVALVRSLQKKHQMLPETALTNYCLVVLNLNELAYLD